MGVGSCPDRRPRGARGGRSRRRCGRRRRRSRPSGPGRSTSACARCSGWTTGHRWLGYLEQHGTPVQVREFLMHRSIYQLREADPHSFGDPADRRRGEGGAGGDPGRRVRRRRPVVDARACCSPRSMRALGLDDTFGAYLDRLPGTTLAWCNLMSLFGLHRRLRGALVGHLAAFEMTSCIPNRRYGDAPAAPGVRRGRHRVLRRARRGRRRPRGRGRERPRRIARRGGARPGGRRPVRRAGAARDGGVASRASLLGAGRRGGRRSRGVRCPTAA